MDERDLMLKAYKHASYFSTDPSTQNSALLIDKGEIVCSAVNEFPIGVKELPERWGRPTKYSYVEHAERNVIYTAARRGIATEGLTMIVPWFACADCARAIIQAGIVRVVGHQTRTGNWTDSIAIAHEMLCEAGVQIEWLEGKIDPTNQVSIIFNGEMIYP